MKDLDRLNIIAAIVEFPINLDELAVQLRGFPWDYDGEPVRLSRAQIIKVLQRHLDGELSTDDVEKWADLMECRDDIDGEVGYEEIVRETVHKLANPALEGPLEKDRVATIINLLSKAP